MTETIFSAIMNPGKHGLPTIEDDVEVVLYQATEEVAQAQSENEMTRKFLDSSRAWIKLSPPLSSKAPPPTTPKRIQKIKKSFQALTSKLQMTRRVLANPLKNSFYVSDPSPQTPSTLTTTSSSEAIDVQSGASRTRPFPTQDQRRKFHLALTTRQSQ